MKTLSLIPLFLWTGLALAQPVLNLYVQPDPASKRISQVSADNPGLGPAVAVGDPAKAAEGWVSASFNRTLTGFVHRSDMGPDNQPTPGAAIFSFPLKGSSSVGTCLQGDAIEILAPGEWSQIRLQRQTVVYYIEPDPSSVTAPPASAATPAREPIREPVVARPITQSFSGTFQQASPRLGLFAAPMPFVLIDDKGKRIAHVDTANIVVSGSLQSFIGKPVVIYGPLEKLPDSNQWVLRAHTIRIR